MSIRPEAPTRLTWCDVELPSPPCPFRDVGVPPIDEIACRFHLLVGFQALVEYRWTTEQLSSIATASPRQHASSTSRSGTCFDA
jgi:hypothetical protein